MRAHRLAGFLAPIIAITLFTQGARAEFLGPYTFAPNDGGLFPSQFPSTAHFTLAIGTWTLSGTIDPAFFSGFYPYMISRPNEFHFDTGFPIHEGFQHFEEISLTHTIVAN